MKYLATFLLICHLKFLGAQPPELDRSFLTVMVIPYTGPDEGVKSVIERDEVCRAVLGQINRTFEERGYRTKDYMAILKLPNKAPDAADLERTENIEAIKNARVDVVVYVEIKLLNLSEGDKQVQLQLQAIDQYSAENYANNISIESTRRRYQDFTQAVKEVQLVNQLKTFADQLDQKFLDILKHGRTVTIKVSFNSKSKSNLNSPLDGSDMDLGGDIEAWVRSHTVRIYPSSGESSYWQAECKLPVLDEKQRSITPYSFRSDFKRYLQQLRISNAPLKVVDQTINSVIEMMVE